MGRRAEVLQAAIELLDEAGLDGLTMRLLADRLGVRASALYRHYPSKQALLDAMVAYLVGSVREDPLPYGPWDRQLRGMASRSRELMLSHRDGARLIAGFDQPGGEAVAAFHRLVDALGAAGVTADLAVLAVDTVLAYVNGYTIEEQARRTGPDDPSGERWDRRFQAGVDLIIAGIRASAPALHAGT
jgi:TetR/AcrR family tetracycline transcriptional repressor